MSKYFTKLLIILCLSLLATLSVSSQSFRQVNIVIEQDSIDELESHPYTNEDVHGSFIIDGVSTDTVEIHYRGAYNLWQLIRTGSLRNWKIKFSKSEKLENRREWNFNYENYIRQNLAYHIFREAGVPCVSTENVILSVNGQRQGLYLKYEDPDNKDWLSYAFGYDEGDLYKAAYDIPGEDKYFADLTYLGDNDEDYFLHYRKQTNNNAEKEFDYSSIREFIYFINYSTDDEFANQIMDKFDVKEFINYLVVANFTANWDGYPFRPKNYFLYVNPLDRKWHFIPWDLDGTFQEVGTGRNSIGITGSVFYYFDGIEAYNYTPTEPLDRPLVWRLMEIEKFRNQYIYEYKQAIESFLTVASITEIIDSLSAGVAANTSGQELSDYNEDVNNTQYFIAARYANVLNELDQYEVDNPYVSIDKSVIYEQGNLHVYPSPASNHIWLELIGAESGIHHVHIVNTLGQRIISKSILSTPETCQSIEIDLSGIPMGYYVLIAETKNGSYTEKFIITR